MGPQVTGSATRGKREGDAKPVTGAISSVRRWRGAILSTGCVATLLLLLLSFEVAMPRPAWCATGRRAGSRPYS